MAKVKRQRKATAATATDLLKMGIIDEIILEDIGGAHRNKEQVILPTKNALIKYLNEFEKYTDEEIFEQRKKKFLSIGRQRSFSTLLKEEDGLIEKDSFLGSVKRNISENKIKLVGILIIFLFIILFLFY